MHSEYGTKEGFCRDVAEFAQENDLICHLHLSETKLEHEECMERHNGMTPTKYFDNIGMLKGKINCAHGV